ncbi:MAG: hypothetical protein ABIN97_17900 [Ginsengibacter sp.]
MFKITNHFFNTNNRSYFITALILFTVFLSYYFLILYLRIGTDIQIHASIAWSFFINDDSIAPNFLYYFLVALTAGFSKYKIAYYAASIIILSLAVVFKYFLNFFYINKYLPWIQRKEVIGLSISLLFIFCLPNIDFFKQIDFKHKIFYLGQLAPNVWHNSTIIFLFPFAILLFFKSYELLYADKFNKNLQWQIFILILLNALIKPSFLFTVIPAVLFLFCLKVVNGNNQKISIIKTIPFIAGSFFIGIEYFIIYRLNYSSKVMSAIDDSKVILSPFEVWSHFSTNIPVAIITSCFFPIVYIFFTGGRILKNKLVLFSALNFVFGVCIWIFFAESGFRKFHGNFYWQVVITIYLFFFSLLLHFINSVKANELSKIKQAFIAGAFILHLLWGIFYWLKIIIFKGYS